MQIYSSPLLYDLIPVSNILLWEQKHPDDRAQEILKTPNQYQWGSKESFPLALLPRIVTAWLHRTTGASVVSPDLCPPQRSPKTTPVMILFSHERRHHDFGTVRKGFLQSWDMNRQQIWVQAWSEVALLHQRITES